VEENGKNHRAGFELTTYILIQNSRLLQLYPAVKLQLQAIELYMEIYR
jgi:hypothetical protein